MLSLESTCAAHASHPADTPRELRGWLRGTGASTASRTGARICALASGERWWGAVMIYGSQGLCIWGSASPPPRRRLWELLPPRPPVRPSAGAVNSSSLGPARGVTGRCDAPWSNGRGSAESRRRVSVGRSAGKVTATPSPGARSGAAAKA